MESQNSFDASEYAVSLPMNLTCPSCRITVMPVRHRSMCPFCGTFYDLNAEVDVNSRSNSRNRESSSDETFRLPQINHERPIIRVTGFGPLITDGIGIIHTYITGLLFRNSIDDETNLFLSLPPINSNRSNHRSESSEFLSGRSIASPEYDTNSKRNGHKFSRKSADDSEISINGTVSVVYPKRRKSISEFRNQINISNENANYSSLHEFYQKTFSSFIELNALFKQNPESDSAKLTDPELNMNLLYAVYDSLNQLPSFISKSVLKGIIASITSNVPLKPKDEIRALFMLIHNPIFSFQSSYSVFAHLQRQIVNVNSGDHQLLIHWLSNSEPERLKSAVKRILQFITIREFPPANGHKLPSISKSRWWIPCAIRVLALLNSANNKNTPNLINYTEFYNYALDHINLMSEYYRWQNPSKNNRFSYCQYPFVLSIVAKKTILQRDSEQQMILNARRSLLNRAIHQEIPDIDVFFLNLNIRRSHLVSDSLNEIARKHGDLKKKLKVNFVGEPGLDMGGLTKEWFLLLIRHIFHQDYGMFVYHSKARCYWFNTTQMGNMKEYNLIGVLMGLAVYNSIILDLHFPTACFKKLLNPPVVPHDVERISSVGICNFTIDDFAEVMPDVAVGLKELLAYEGNVEEDFCMTFQVSVEEFGEVKTHVLKPGGEEMPVTNENKEEFVHLYMDLILNKAINLPFKAFYLGFHSVCASNALIMLRPEEVEMLVCGCPTIDMNELRKVTVYDGFHEDDAIINDFWDIVKSFNFDMQKQFLRFTTGSDRVPVGGMSEMTFKISSLNNNLQMLPISHTCFNQIVFPRYKTREELREKLIIAISNAEGFGLE